MRADERPLAVELRGVTKRFGALVANDHVDVAVHAGEIHAIIGENGAGKSTALALMFGIHAPDGGAVAIEGVERRLSGPRDAIALGLGMVHQHFSLVPQLTVCENVVIGAEPRKGLRLDRAAAARAVNDLATQFDLDVDPDRRVADLSVGECQWVELLKALHRGAQTLLLDEPTAVLTPREVERLCDALRLLRQQGRTVILVTHKLAEVFAVADGVTVMRAGKSILATRTASTTPDDLALAMIGRQPEPPPERQGRGDEHVPLLTVRNVRLDVDGRTRVDDVSLEVRSGEILGIAGVEGNGQNELLEGVKGLVPLAAGDIVFGDGVSAGEIGFVPADRRHHGLVLDMTVAENCILGRQGDPDYCGPVFSRTGAILAHANDLVKKFDVRPPFVDAHVGTFSGGNQQKVVVGRELAGAPRILLVAQPTRGVDIGAIEIIHAALRAARDRGAAIVLVSSDLDELLALSDRMLVMFRGRLVGEVDPRKSTATEIGLLMTGGKGAVGG
jgi:general nucleoside transport system ATP-binding protein